MSIGKKICGMLVEMMPEVVERVRCTRVDEEDIAVDFMRNDSAKIMHDMGLELFSPYYTGSVYHEKPKDTLVGDIPVPKFKEEAKEKDFRRAGCDVGDIHRYHQFGVSHIHIECPDASKRIHELIKLLTG